jgi:integrase
LNTLAGLPGTDGQPLGPRAIGSITQADLETAFAALRGNEYAASTRNKMLTLVDLLSWWGVKKGYLTRPWRSKDDESEIGRERGAKRDRRVEPDEERNVFEQATPFLQRLIIAALETCCREDEILSLQWHDLSLARQEFTVQPEDAKTGKARTLPMSVRFKALVELLRHDPAGNEHPGAAYVFGNAIGDKVTFPRKAWETAVLKAHGHTPTWTRTNGLAPESRAALAAIDLHFHDLRHEGASRLLEAGWPLHHIQHMLGHASLAQTAEYLNIAARGLHDSMKRFGTLSLHPVAPEPSAEHVPHVQRQEREIQKPTVN